MTLNTSPPGKVPLARRRPMSVVAFPQSPLSTSPRQITGQNQPGLSSKTPLHPSRPPSSFNGPSHRQCSLPSNSLAHHAHSFTYIARKQVDLSKAGLGTLSLQSHRSRFVFHLLSQATFGGNSFEAEHRMSVIKHLFTAKVASLLFPANPNAQRSCLSFVILRVVSFVRLLEWRNDDDARCTYVS